MSNESTWYDYEQRLARTAVRAAGRIAARIATANGSRKPLAWLEDELFAGMCDEVETAGAGKRVAAGMFGVSHRTYLRRSSAARDRLGEIGSSLWWRTHESLVRRPMSREEVLLAFATHSEETVGAILHDMQQTGWIVEQDGRFSAAAGDAWDKTRLLQFAKSLLQLRPELNVEDLARRSGVDIETVESWLAEDDTPKFVRGATNESKYVVLAMMVEHVMYLAYNQLGEQPSADAKIWRVRFKRKSASIVDELRSLVASTGQQLNEAYVEFTSRVGGVPWQEADEESYSFMLSEADMHADGWVDL